MMSSRPADETHAKWQDSASLTPSPSTDERIHPDIRIVSIERAETDPVFLAHRIVAEAEKHGQETSAHGDLEHALQLCVERMSMGQIAGVLQQLQSQK